MNRKHIQPGWHMLAGQNLRITEEMSQNPAIIPFLDGKPIIREPMKTHQADYLRLAKFFADNGATAVAYALTLQASKCQRITKRQYQQVIAAIQRGREDAKLMTIQQAATEQTVLDAFAVLKSTTFGKPFIVRAKYYNSREVWSDYDMGVPGTVTRWVWCYVGTDDANLSDIHGRALGGKTRYNSIGTNPASHAWREFSHLLFCNAADLFRYTEREVNTGRDWQELQFFISNNTPPKNPVGYPKRFVVEVWSGDRVGSIRPAKPQEPDGWHDTPANTVPMFVTVTAWDEQIPEIMPGVTHLYDFENNGVSVPSD